MILAKPKRIEDKKAIEDVRKTYCELCGRSGGQFGVHHIRAKGYSKKGHDIPVNMINLCDGPGDTCHRKAQEYKIKPLTLIKITCRREGITLEEAYEQIGWVVPDEAIEKKEPEKEYTLEELVQAYISLQEKENETRWVKGQILDILLEKGVKPGWIASQVGVSAAQIRVMVQTFRAFPEEKKRNPALTWFHHRIAAHTEEPERWLNEAADNEFSTRQMQAVIKGATESADDKRKAEAERTLRSVKNFLDAKDKLSVWFFNELQETIKKYSA